MTPQKRDDGDPCARCGKFCYRWRSFHVLDCNGNIPRKEGGSVSLFYRAASLMVRAHGDEQRRYNQGLYILHPLQVAQLAANYGCSIDAQCAAMLHDTIENTWVDRKTIDTAFPNNPRIGQMVWDMTDRETVGNRAQRKMNEALRLANCERETQTVKICDCISNTPSVCENDPGFAKVYLPEMARLGLLLTHANVHARRDLRKMIDRYTKRLGL